MDFETLKITAKQTDLGFSLARRLAEERVTEILTEPMLVAWYDGKKNEEHPQVAECQHKPGWIAYAEGHGGRIRVDVNENEYSFIFADVG